jgi:hypothetical protein
LLNYLIKLGLGQFKVTVRGRDKDVYLSVGYMVITRVKSLYLPSKCRSYLHPGSDKNRRSRLKYTSVLE